MEVPDVLVVTKADLGDVALRAQRDLHAALRSLGSTDTPVVSVSSLPPPSGIDQLVVALDEHRARIDVPASRLRSRHLAALADFSAEHGERPLRALGGRRAAERLLAGEDPGLTTAELTERLELLAREAGATD
jgi:LAO/AO transport system kinase